MTPRTLGLTDPLHEYLLQVGFREHSALKRVREETPHLPGVHMLLAPEQAHFMALLARLLGVRRYLEIGTYTGYSALAIALALEPDGKVLTCDIDAEITKTAKRHWQQAGVADKIELRLGPALGTLDALVTQGEHGRFDMAFIDADKENLLAYYERCHALVRPAGLILIDNTLWSGSVADDSDQEPSTEAVRAFNLAVHQDQRVEMVLLPIGDGLTLARKIL
jgi:predicted O-methyltransferase YrrM